MTSLKFNTKIDADGNLRLDVPLGLPAGNVEVVIVVQAERDNGNGKVGTARSGLFTANSAPDIDVDSTLNEMNQAWKSKL